MSFDIRAHYSRVDVAREICEFSRGRWVAVEGSYGDKRVFVRYYRDRPLTISSESDVLAIVNRYKRLCARTFYATIHVYKSLESSSLLDDPGNIAYSTPFFDIDGALEDYKGVLEVASLIVDFLENYGLKESVYILWSGNGAHVRINERAFSSEVLSKYNPVVVAHSIVEYVLREIRERLERVARSSSVKVENLVDAKRVFTAPLSLHRSRNTVAVCFKPSAISSFEPAWVEPGSFKHDPSAWRSFKQGEGDALAFEALKKISGQRLVHSRVGLVEQTRRRKTATQAPITSGKIGRFQVMGLLQAARYYLLHGDLERAKSYGLNRAIFYAWAKHYGRGYVARSSRHFDIDLITLSEERAGETSDQLKRRVEVLGESVFTSPRGFFVIGDKEQLPEDYDKNITSKIESIIPYDLAWEAALKYLSRFPRQVLEDPIKFYEKVYEPVRDHFVELVVKELADEETSEEPEETSQETQREHRAKQAGEKKYGLFKWMKNLNVGNK